MICMSKQLQYIVVLLFMVPLAAAQTANAQSITVELAEKTPPADPGDPTMPGPPPTTTTTTTLPTIPRCPNSIAGATAGNAWLISDEVIGSDATFLVDLPNGTYTVTPTSGDEIYANVGPTAIYANGQLVASGISTEPSQFWTATYTVNVTAGQLALRLLGGFVLNSLQIQPVSTPSSGILFDFGPAGSWVADGAIAMDTAAYNPSLGYGWASGSVDLDTRYRVRRQQKTTGASTTQLSAVSTMEVLSTASKTPMPIQREATEWTGRS